MRHLDRIVAVKGLTKRYGAVEAVRGIDFHVRRGQMFAFLGPNGAGKSTTIDILSTLLTPDSGEVWINGHRLGSDNGAIRAEIGVVFQQNVLDRLLTVRENLQTRARFYAGVRPVDIDVAMDVADVRPFADRPYGKLSGGQRRRADIARALVHTPRLLLLDEPTTGLDPQTRRSVWDTIHTIVSQQDMSVFFSTHYMEEAAQADFITIIDGGHIAAEGTPMQLKERYARDSVRLYARDTAAVGAMLRALGHAFDAPGDGVLSIPMQGKDATLALLHHVAPAIDDFEVIHGTMDDVFIQVTGKEVRDG